MNDVMRTKFEAHHSGPQNYPTIFAGGDGEGGNIERFFIHCHRNEIGRIRFRLSKSYSRWGFDLAMASKEPALQVSGMGAYEFTKMMLSVLENDLIGAQSPVFVDSDILRKSVLNLVDQPFLLNRDRLKKSFDHMLKFKNDHDGQVFCWESS